MKSIYNALPNFLQDAAVSIVGWQQKRKRYDKYFHQKLEEYIERDSISKDKLFEYQRTKLKSALEQASKTPYYSKLFEEMGVHWSELADLKSFVKIPLTYKTDVAKNPTLFMPRAAKEGDIRISTSGTTGQSLSFNASQNFDSEQWVVWWRYRYRFGINLGTKCALFSSTPIIPPNENTRFWRLNSAYNEYRFSVFHISDRTVKSYVDSLNSIQAPWIHGNPSAIALLAQLITRNNLKLKYQPSWLSIGSENLQPWQAAAIENVFGVKPIQHYGLMEGVSNISQCRCGKLHVDEDFAYTEFVKNEHSGSFSIVGTAFNNDAFSLLRYVTGDLATPDTTTTICKCGFNGRLVSAIDGRQTDYITMPNGERVASLAGPLHSTSGLAEAQIFQDKTGALTVRYVPTTGWIDSNIDSIARKMRDRIGSEIQIKFQKVDAVERTSRGKIKLVISEYEHHA